MGRKSKWCFGVPYNILKLLGITSGAFKNFLSNIEIRND